MRKCFTLFIICLLYHGKLLSQNNCSNPLQVTVCPSVYLSNQTNAGMGDDAPNPYNIVGEDLVYQLNVINGASSIYVSVINVTATLKLTLLPGNCTTGNTYSRLAYPGNRGFIFYVGNQTTNYLWIDAAVGTTFDISIGADTGLTYINIPNTRGNIRFDSSGCGLPAFNATKPFFRVSYNGVFQTNPMTLSPLNVPGTMCIDAFLKNKTGIEGIKKIDIFFNGGYTNVTTNDTIPGFYNTGNWIGRIAGNDWTFNFLDSAGISRGDFTGTPDSCLNYHFCFDVTPVSNNPIATNVAMNFYTDGFGAGYSGYVHSGCCSSLNPNCFGSFGGAGGSTSFGFSFDDPGSPLPVELIEFSCEINETKIRLHWSTASETNNDYFSIEKSMDSQSWTKVGQVSSAGNSITENNYTWIDDNPNYGINYYRLKQVDFDGTFSYSKIIAYEYLNKNDLIVYPNPVDEKLNIETDNEVTKRYSLFNLFGEKTIEPFYTSSGKVQINTIPLPSGVYFLLVSFDNGKTECRKIIIRH